MAHTSYSSYLPSCFCWTDRYFLRQVNKTEKTYMTLKIVLIVWYLQSFCLQASFASTLEREVVKAERQRATGNTNENSSPFTDIVITISIKCNKIKQHARWNSRGVLFSPLYVLSTSAFQHFQVWVKMRKRRPCSDHAKAKFIHLKQLFFILTLFPSSFSITISFLL